MKFSHRNLEAIRKNPVNFKQILGASGGRQSMARYWQFAARKFHQNNSIEMAVSYYEKICLKNFVNNSANSTKISNLVDKLYKYSEDYESLNVNYYDYSNRISVDIQNNNFITGEVFRLDKKVNEGYKVTLFSKEDTIWANELRYPLLQIYYSNIFECPVMDIDVGIYNFSTDTHDYLCFDEKTLKQAWDEVTQISDSILKNI